jgi:glucose-specific phosphotransferase system IIA component
MSLYDTYKCVAASMEDDKPKLFRQLDEHIDWDSLIPARFYLAFYRNIGRPRKYPLVAFLKSLVLQKIFGYVNDSVLLVTLRHSREMRNFCGFEKVPDAVFSQKTLGEGAAIMPEDGLVTAPCDGTIAYVPDTKHAIALTSTKGVEVLIHVGIDTVSLQGEGFDALVKEGDSVSRGQGLLQVDLSLLASKKMNPVTPLVVTGGAASITLLQKEGTRVESGKDAIVSVKEEEE